jgi:hypothetical protein
MTGHNTGISKNPGIRTSQSCAAEARQAVKEFHAGVVQPDMELVIFFCSTKYNLKVVAEEIASLFEGVQVIGCTSAGEFGPLGYFQHGITGVSFSKDICSAVIDSFDHLNDFNFSTGNSFAQNLIQKLEKKAPQANPENIFSFLLIDGLSLREEPVAYVLQHALDRIPLFGGSAGDDQQFKETFIYFNGHFQSDSLVMALINMSLPINIFKLQHFVSTNERLVVTESDITHRTVYEINGLPAAQEYARLIGVDVSDLSPMHFAASPVVVLIGGTNYVRSIQKVNPDGSLTFYCAIEEGVVLRLAHGEDLVENLDRTFQKIKEEVGQPLVVLGCDCILRYLEMVQKGITEKVEDIFQRNNVVGFNGYGEQYWGVNVNQTFTGIAIGSSSRSK